jgi:putative transposase
MAIVAGGEPPLILYTDNGVGYRNDRMVQVAARLGFEHHFGIPYNSQARGVVERLQKTLWIDLAAKTFATYVGAQMDREARQIVFKASRRGEPVLPSWRTFVAFMDQAVAAYNARPSRGCPKALDMETGRQKHLSPSGTWSRAEALGWKPEGLAVSMADFRPQELRTVARGEVKLFGNTYFNKDLQELHGEQVQITFDIHDAAKVWIHRQDGTFVCEAGFEANKSPYFPKPYVETLREQRKDGQRKRLSAKQERVLGEPLEPVEIRELTPEALEASASQMRKLGVLPIAPQPAPEPAPQAETERLRPAFRDDREYALWVLDHPDLADAEEVQEIMLRLRNDQFFRVRLDRDANGQSASA